MLLLAAQERLVTIKEGMLHHTGAEVTQQSDADARHHQGLAAAVHNVRRVPALPCRSNTDPPIARIVDYKALLHEQQVKAEEAARKKRLQQKLATPKEMYFTTQIAGEGAWFPGMHGYWRRG